ncbi:MAG TPA: cytochrome C [Desulfuromonadales bacterium]|nr:cytochrome C [Desulfuromonadales bacterium]
MLVIVSFFLTNNSLATQLHGGPVCSSCHGQTTARDQVTGCVVCHPGKELIFERAMSRRSGEKSFVERSYARVDSGFWDKNCTSCHLKSCRDCHGTGPVISKPNVAACQKCHKGYYTGGDYSGRAPRENNMRYQRGIAVEGETFLKMLPDVHYTAGMICSACHSMQSLVEGKKSSHVCRNCHRISSNVIEHSIPAHLEKLECYACHSAWGAQEYGTFFLRFRDLRMKVDFDLKPTSSTEYLRSAYLRKQDAPPLGINARGRVSPIRPLFISYYTDIAAARDNGPENSLLAAEWRAWFPHTIQRGSVTCEGCHDNPARFLLEPESRRIYNLQKDGMTLDSFWRQKGQRVVNGSFMSASRYQQISNKSPAYTKAYVKKWKKLLNRDDHSLRP